MSKIILIINKFILFLIKEICYFYWATYRWNKYCGSSENIAKWQAEAALNIMSVWLLSPFLTKLTYMNIIPGTKYEYILAMLPFFVFNYLLINFILSKYFPENLIKFNQLSKNESSKHDRFLIVFFLIGLSGTIFIVSSLRNEHLKKFPRTSVPQATEATRM